MNQTIHKLESNSIAQKVYDWVMAGAGDFAESDIWRALDLIDADQKKMCSQTLKRMLKQGEIESIGKRYGWYRRVDRSLDIIDWKSASTEEFPIRLPFQLHKQARIFPKTVIVVSGEKNTGKALRNGTPVLTDNGFVPIEGLKKGDCIYGKQGQSEDVTGVHPQGVRHCYRFIFNDGTWVDSDKNHIWTIQTAEQMYKEKSGHGAYNPTYKKWINATTFEIIKRYGVGRVKKIPPKFPSCRPVNLPEIKVPIDPYILGALLGDGSIISGSPSFSSADQEIISYFKDAGYILKKDGKYGIRISTQQEYIKQNSRIRNGYIVNGFISNKQKAPNHLRLKTQLQGLGLWGKGAKTKSVPSEYLFNSVKVRTEILKGLMDTDGSIDKKGWIEFSSISVQLANDVQFLVKSLGGRANISKRQTFYYKDDLKIQGEDSYRVSIKIKGVEIFKLPRKLKRQKDKTHKKTNKRRLVEIVYQGRYNATCVTTTAKDGLFIIKDFIVTHNSAFCLNLVAMNQNIYIDMLESFAPIYYFSSEMLAPEFKVRLQGFREIPKDDWNFKPIHRTENFEDVIQPDAINIIDFLEIHDKFWLIGQAITNIWKRLDKGIAIVCVQKADGQEHGRGGSFLVEKPRLTINLSKRFNDSGELDGAVCKVTNCKFPRSPANPNGKSLDYYCIGGTDLNPIGSWYFNTQKK